MAHLTLDHALPGTLPNFAVLVGREVAARVSSLWMYLLASAACMIALVYGAAFQSAFETETVLVSSNPMAVLNAVIAGFLALVLGLRLAASLAWERENQTLEVLLVAPVGARTVLYAKFVGELAILLLIVAIYAAYLGLGQPLGDGVVRWQDIGSLVAVVPFMLPVMALGLLVSAFFSHIRAAVLAFLIVAGVLVGYEIVLSSLEGALPQNLSLVQIFIKAGLTGADAVVGRLSHIAPLADLVRTSFHQTAPGWLDMAWATALAVVTLGVSAELLRVRGQR